MVGVGVDIEISYRLSSRSSKKGFLSLKHFSKINFFKMLIMIFSVRGLFLYYSFGEALKFLGIGERRLYDLSK